MTKKEKNNIIKRNECLNHILLNKHPYFFRYLYKETNNKIRKYIKTQDTLCLHVHNMTLKELMDLEQRTEQQQKFLDDYYLKAPVIYSNSTMNMLCKYLEGFKQTISQQVAIVDQTDFYELYKKPNVKYSERTYRRIKNTMLDHLKTKENSNYIGAYTLELNRKSTDSMWFDEREILKTKFLIIVDDIDVIVNCLVDFFYKERIKSSKDVLWFGFGDVMFKNVQQNTKEKIYFPMEDKNGDISYFGKKFSWKEVTF